ncbi:hypothetical protein [Microtetraspora malaysiensis]|uniref:Uncharacterized protein n=1 Tax=Microtetraspora malaysiensis TaxID=161358 RepID=A0ABW6SK92_9ACTN
MAIISQSADCALTPFEILDAALAIRTIANAHFHGPISSADADALGRLQTMPGLSRAEDAAIRYVRNSGDIWPLPDQRAEVFHGLLGRLLPTPEGSVR